MNIIRKLFGGKSNTSVKDEVMLNISSISNIELPSNYKIAAETQIPAFCSIGNLIFEKKYFEAINLGETLLKETPYSVGVHVNLMDAYFKARKENSTFYDKSIEHARLAMLYGHNTGYAQKKLAIGLEKQRKIYQAIQVCNIILSDDYHFSRHGCGNIVEFANRKERLLKKVPNSLDDENSFLFTESEISYMIKQIQEDDELIVQEEIEYKRKMEQLRKDSDALWDSLMKGK
ncbi:hypothetical protein LV84_01452 [Algoriphagus ratkowskyi]|uniref:Tetratricopeptide repeat protein n=1 Tax=Algoriphagus ratkowskyi TaxID=57028 RepID=A0A2W7RB95_9BACT|nr:hypothetical protein [Algoriphagus ratkowskyi]PZX58248.1 hypothetical protein LV84_01452 [Algoriphagus ratkowskyi]TXD77872.1 hypothetical protein ESW18_10940 [Algoriphagus ratkowskyi]